MAWQRLGDKRYYTRSRWQKGRVRRDYIGKGKASRLAEMLDELIHGERKGLLEAYQTLRRQDEQLQGLSWQFEQFAELVTGAALWAEGFGVMGRHLWRHRPHLASLDAEWVDIGLVEQVRDLVLRAQRRRHAAVEELQQLLAGTAVWVAVDTLGEAAHSLCLDLAAGDRPETRQTLEHQAREVRRCLATTVDTPLDRLFAQRAALAWLEAYSVHEALVQLKDLAVYPPRFLVGHEEEACRRYRAAVQGLGHLRHLRKPEERTVQSPS
jgi:hypothetical protein